PRSLPLWRPWLPRAEEGTERPREQTDTAWTLQAAGDSSHDKVLAFFRHPVRYVPSHWRPRPRALGRQGGLSRVSPHRLLWPRSRCFDYLYSVGEKLLENFPVQATLCLYEDSGSEDSEDEEEEDEEEEEEDEEEEAAGAPLPRPD
ncbi:RIPP1 protein, partial [Crotophaga sulcirostris]|nr:RIPP1 protein [Crotophaga sulcirostris]